MIDPEGAVLAKWDVELPTMMLRKTAVDGATPMARYSAIAGLSEKDDDESRMTLKTILADDKLDRTYRMEAAWALGSMQQVAARDILIGELNKAGTEPRVIRAMIEAVSKYRDKRVALGLGSMVTSGETITIKAAALAGLGRQEPTEEIIQALLENAKKPAFRDLLRTSAVRALADLAEPRGIEPAMALAAYGQPYRTRPRGIDAIARIGSVMEMKDRTPARKFLEKLLADPIENVQYAAAKALGDLGDEKAADALQAFADGSGPKNAKEVAREALDVLRKKNGEPAMVKDLRDRVEALEKARERVEKEIEAEGKGKPTTQSN